LLDLNDRLKRSLEELGREYHLSRLFAGRAFEDCIQDSLHGVAHGLDLIFQRAHPLIEAK
jgi:hypothetical protein